MIAYQGNAAVRGAVLETLSAAIDNGEFLPDDPATLSDRLNAVTAVTGSNDLAQFETKTGMAASLGLLLNAILRAIARDREMARSFAKDWFAAPSAGSDLSAVGSGMAAWFLTKTLNDDMDLAPPIRSSLEAVRKLHIADERAEKPSRKDWSAARAAALAATDAASSDCDRQSGDLAETLAWSTSTSKTVLADALRIWCSLKSSRAAERSGWTGSKRAEADRVMHEIYDATATERDSDPQTYEFHKHFAAARPEMAAAFLAALQLQNEQYASSAEEAGRAALTMMKAVATR